MWTSDFWKRAAERAIRTFAQALLGALTAGLVVTDSAQWTAALIAAAVAALASVLMSLAGSAVGDPSDPSLLPAASKPEPVDPDDY